MTAAAAPPRLDGPHTLAAILADLARLGLARLLTCSRCGGKYDDTPPGHAAHAVVFGHEPSPARPATTTTEEHPE